MRGRKSKSVWEEKGDFLRKATRHVAAEFGSGCGCGCWLGWLEGSVLDKVIGTGYFQATRGKLMHVDTETHCKRVLLGIIVP